MFRALFKQNSNSNLEEETVTFPACSLEGKVAAKDSVTAQAVQEKLDYHFIPILEPDAFDLNSFKRKAVRGWNALAHSQCMAAIWLRFPLLGEV